MYEVVAVGNVIIETNLTRAQARKIVRQAWNEERRVLYYRKVGTLTPLYIAN